MSNNIFVVNKRVPTNVLENVLNDKIFQVKALIECLRLAATTSELNNKLVHDIVWAIGNDLEEVVQLQEVLHNG
jgi:hypothetical protein